MEIPTEAAAGYGYFTVKPPRLEDAGLEETALSPEGIEEAFRLAAQKVKSAATGVLENFGGLKERDDDEDDACTQAPSPGFTDWEPAQGRHDGSKQQGSCVETQTGGLIEEGRDSVVDPAGSTEDQIVSGEEPGPRLGQSGCIKDGENEPTKPKKKKKNEDEDDLPGLTEAAI